MIRYFLLKFLNLTNRTDRLWGGGSEKNEAFVLKNVDIPCTGTECCGAGAVKKGAALAPQHWVPVLRLTDNPRRVPLHGTYHK